MCLEDAEDMFTFLANCRSFILLRFVSLSYSDLPMVEDFRIDFKQSLNIELINNLRLSDNVQAPIKGIDLLTIEVKTNERGREPSLLFFFSLNPNTSSFKD